MNKKNIFLFLLMALPTLLLTSCLKDQEDTFDKPSATRMSEYLANAASVLKAPANGWVLYYYPDKEQSYGGYAFTLKFDDEKVEVGVEDDDDPSLTYTSLYKLISDDGPVLTFDTYNKAMHAFATPSAGAYEALGGDFEFIIIDASAEKVELKGKRSGNLMTMYPLQTSGEEFRATVTSIIEDMTFTAYTLSLGGEDVKVGVGTRNFTFTYGEEEPVTAAYAFTPEGIKFYEPVEINGKTISGFKYQEGAVSYQSLDDASIVLNGIVPPLSEMLIGGLWATSLSNIGTFGAPYWTAVKEQVMGPVLGGETLEYFYFGDGGNGFGAYFRSSGYAGVLGFDAKVVSDDEVTLSYNAKGNKSNGDWYVANAYFHYLIVPFGCDTKAEPVERTFKLSGNHPKSPSVLTLTDEANPDNVIRLLDSDVDPFNE